ncbi:hypothetical protein RFI_03472 [Reticulomyxa filosa]|uniref:Thioredoxin domain-containing protein n=1 Tax=Reticulomyxa filosa TaxID=46433 RepID=X6P507_RETFI|nr:hypothetical protein RFI_03472 [Reticulomyxa filosa]|eukprot:ETO33630.1 hypothetical protein RFI_03472 [Reticulomyxa filosa]
MLDICSHGFQCQQQSFSANLLYLPNTTQCVIDYGHEQALLLNLSLYGLWQPIKIYNDNYNVHTIISHQNNIMLVKDTNFQLRQLLCGESASAKVHRAQRKNKSFILILHYGTYCPFSAHIFPLFFEIASEFGIEKIDYYLIQSLSPWVFSSKQSVTEIKLYNIHGDLISKYITSGHRSIKSLKYWLRQYTNISPHYHRVMPLPDMHRYSKDGDNKFWSPLPTYVKYPFTNDSFFQMYLRISEFLLQEKEPLLNQTQWVLNSTYLCKRKPMLMLTSDLSTSGDIHTLIQNYSNLTYHLSSSSSSSSDANAAAQYKELCIRTDPDSANNEPLFELDIWDDTFYLIPKDADVNPFVEKKLGVAIEKDSFGVQFLKLTSILDDQMIAIISIVLTCFSDKFDLQFKYFIHRTKKSNHFYY